MAQHVYRHICVLQHISIKGCSGTQSTVRGFPQQPDTQHTVVRHCKSCCGVLSRSTWISVGLVWMFSLLIMIFTLPAGAVAKYCDEYLFCGSVCLRGYLRNHSCNFYQIFYACCLCLWLCPPPCLLYAASPIARKGFSSPLKMHSHATVDIGASANLELVDKLFYLGDMLRVDGDADAAVEARIQTGWNWGSWYHCLPIGIYHWLGEGGCIAVVCEVVCYMDTRPGLSRKKMRWHFSKQRWEWSDGCVMLS